MKVNQDAIHEDSNAEESKRLLAFQGPWENGHSNLYPIILFLRPLILTSSSLFETILAPL